MTARVFEEPVLVPTLILLSVLLFYSITIFVDALHHTLFRSIIVIIPALNLSYPEIKTLLTAHHTLKCPLSLRASVALAVSI
jgi:dolichol kinase